MNGSFLSPEIFLTQYCQHLYFSILIKMYKCTNFTNFYFLSHHLFSHTFMLFDSILLLLQLGTKEVNSVAHYVEILGHMFEVI